MLTKYMGVFIAMKSRKKYTCFTLTDKRINQLQLVTCLSWDSWVHKPDLTHLSLIHSPGPSVARCVHYQ